MSVRCLGFGFLIFRRVYLEQIKVLRTGVSLHVFSRNNEKGFLFFFVGYRIEIMINRDGAGANVFLREK